MQIIKNISSISGGDLCECSWGESRQHYETGESGCPILIPNFIRGTKSFDNLNAQANIDPKEFCRTFCCTSNSFNPRLHGAPLPPPLFYAHNYAIYSCNTNRKIGYLSGGIIF